MTLRLDLIDAPTSADRQAIVAPLQSYNNSQAGISQGALLVIAVRDEATAAIVGGLWGRTSHNWCFVDLLVVPESHRGQGLGRALMAQAEVIARDRACVGIHLSTFEFQARGFYEKLGFEVFGTLDDHPRGWKSYFMRKHFG